MYRGIIRSDPSIMMGKPVIAGTRITVERILEKLAAGETVEQILEAHPRLAREATQAGLVFITEALRAGVVYPLPGEYGSMKFLADKNVDKPIVERLRDDGHTVLYLYVLERMFRQAFRPIR